MKVNLAKHKDTPSVDSFFNALYSTIIAYEYKFACYKSK